MYNRFELKFEWDEKKNRKNKVKHGVSFETAAMVFSDIKKVEIFDRKHSIFEERWKVVGFSGLKMLTVVFTERRNSIRIITARNADKNEEEAYYGYSKIHTN